MASVLAFVIKTLTKAQTCTDLINEFLETAGAV